MMESANSKQRKSDSVNVSDSTNDETLAEIEEDEELPEVDSSNLMPDPDGAIEKTSDNRRTDIESGGPI